MESIIVELLLNSQIIYYIDTIRRLREEDTWKSKHQKASLHLRVEFAKKAEGRNKLNYLFLVSKKEKSMVLSP